MNALLGKHLPRHSAARSIWTILLGRSLLPATFTNKVMWQTLGKSHHRTPWKGLPLLPPTIPQGSAARCLDLWLKGPPNLDT